MTNFLKVGKDGGGGILGLHARLTLPPKILCMWVAVLKYTNTVKRLNNFNI